MKDLEKEMFSRSIDTLLHKDNGVLVIDDELISSRANDVETKTVSQRKTGKEGPVVDCVSCYFTSVLFGLRLRVKGESQEQNIEKLIETLPKLTSIHDKVTLTFDRGYGKLKFVNTNASKNFDINTIATVGSRHPFIPPEEVVTFVNNCKKGGGGKILK